MYYRAPARSFSNFRERCRPAVGGAAGWGGGLGALGGFVLPPGMGFAVSDLGKRGYPIGFIVFVFLSIFALSTVWILKYSQDSRKPAKQ